MPSSGEKREPASDIKTVVVDSLKALDLKRPIREADIGGHCNSVVPDPKRRFPTANYRTAKGSLDHLVGGGEERLRNAQAKGFGGL